MQKTCRWDSSKCDYPRPLSTDPIAHLSKRCTRRNKSLCCCSIEHRARLLPTHLNWIALLLGKSGLILQNSTYALEHWWMRIVEKNVSHGFSSRDRAREWYQSERHQKVAQHRFKSAKTNMIIAEGFSERGFVYSVKSE